VTTIDLLAGALSETLKSVRSDGRVPHHTAALLRNAFTEQKHRGEETQPQDIVSALPAFETLSEVTRQSLYATVRNDDWWSMLFRRASWRQVLTRAVRTAGLRIPGRYRRLRRLVELGEFLFLYWQARLVHMSYRKALTWRGWRSRTPTLAAALTIAGLDARLIASSYLHGIPQAMDTAGYWHDPSRHATVGVVVGIDFIVNDDGVWFVESNLNVGLMEERSRLYAVDPFVTNLVRFARRNGYTSMIFLACNDVPVDDIMAARIEQAALDAGLRATVLEDRYAPQRRLSQTFLVPHIDERTLVVRSKMFHTSLDALFHHKTLSFRAIESYQRVFQDQDARLPPTGANSVPDTLVMNGPFPNVVCKFPERDQGQGVLFLRVSSLAQAKAIIDDRTEMNRVSVANVWTKLRYRLKLEDQAAMFQTYIPSSLLEGRRLSITRAHVLATPVGIEFLSAHRVVSNRPVPESLAEGLVQDPRPYIVNYSLDSVHAQVPPDEELRVNKAALSVVRALCWAVESRFQTSPGDLGGDERRREPPT
jgi:hypothetical protein